METPNQPQTAAGSKPKKRRSVRHTRAIQRDRRLRPTSAPPPEAVVERLREIVHPATLAQVSYFHTLGLRARVLTLPVMMGLVLGLLWRQIGGVAELVRVVQRETVLWVPPLRNLSQQALSQRLRSLPAQLFERVLNGVLPVAQALAGGKAAITAGESCLRGFAPRLGGHRGLFRLINDNAFHVDPRHSAHRPELNGVAATVLQLLLAGVVDALKERRVLDDLGMTATSAPRAGEVASVG